MKQDCLKWNNEMFNEYECDKREFNSSRIVYADLIPVLRKDLLFRLPGSDSISEQLQSNPKVIGMETDEIQLEVDNKCK